LENVRQYGAIPVLSWNSGTTGTGVNEPRARLSRIIHGKYDRQLRKFARQAHEWGHPFFLRFNWEMNGFWFPWSEGVNHNHSGQYVKAWRHVHRIFSAEGATNATWVWCPNVNISGQLRNLPSLYPGRRFVDWTCLDGYNWGLRRGSPGWLGFDQIYRSTYREITRSVAPRKPMMLAELASTDRGGSKAAWIRHMLHRVRTRYGKVRAIAWFDQEERNTHWPIESSQASIRAFRQGIANPAFRPNEYGSLPPGRISPP
jgi:beta-mannanase